MEIQLILARLTAQCQATEKVWQSVCDEMNLDLHVYEVDSDEGQSLIDGINIKSFPALIVNGKIIAVGNPDRQTAEKILHSLH